MEPIIDQFWKMAMADPKPVKAASSPDEPTSSKREEYVNLFNINVVDATAAPNLSDLIP